MRKIEVILSCSPAITFEIIKKNTSPAKGMRLFGNFKDPMFWAKVSANKAVIWPKGGKDISATKMKLKIMKEQEGTSIKGLIIHYDIVTIPTWLFAISVFSYFIAFIGAALLLLTANEYFVPVFIFALFSFLIFFMGLMQRISAGQEEQLEKFFKDIFKENIKKTIA